METKERYKCVIETKYYGKYQKKILWGTKIEDLCSKAKNELGVMSVKIYDYKHRGWLVVYWW